MNRRHAYSSFFFPISYHHCQKVIVNCNINNESRKNNKFQKEARKGPYSKKSLSVVCHYRGSYWRCNIIDFLFKYLMYFHACIDPPPSFLSQWMPPTELILYENPSSWLQQNHFASNAPVEEVAKSLAWSWRPRLATNEAKLELGYVLGVEVGSYEQLPVIVLSNTTSQSTALKNPFQEIMGVSRFKPTTAEWGVYHCDLKHWVWLGYVRFPNFGSKGLLINTIHTLNLLSKASQLASKCL